MSKRAVSLRRPKYEVETVRKKGVVELSPGKLLEADDQSPALPSNPPAGTTASLLDPSFVISDKSLENFFQFRNNQAFP